MGSCPDTDIDLKYLPLVGTFHISKSHFQAVCNIQWCQQPMAFDVCLERLDSSVQTHSVFLAPQADKSQASLRDTLPLHLQHSP